MYLLTGRLGTTSLRVSGVRAGSDLESMEVVASVETYGLSRSISAYVSP